MGDAGVVAALGESTTRRPLKLRYTEDYKRLALSTALPFLMMDGPAKEDSTSILCDFEFGMKAGANGWWQRVIRFKGGSPGIGRWGFVIIH